MPADKANMKGNAAGLEKTPFALRIVPVAESCWASTRDKLKRVRRTGENLTGLANNVCS
jgi:hypothetical protein